jgi:hypothetical protein
MTGRAAETAVVSAAALVLTLLIAAPVLRAPSERIFGAEIVGRHHDPFTVMRQFSLPLTLGIYSQPLTDIPGALLARVSGPVAAYNWLVLITFPLSAAAAFLLARHLALTPAAAFIAALAFAFSPFHLAQAAYHPHIAQTQWIPLYLLALWRCMDAPNRASAAWLVLSIAGVALSNFYGGLIAATITPVGIAAYWFFRSRTGPRPARGLAITIGILTVAAAGGLAYAWAAARPVVLNPAAFGFARDDLFRYSAKWWSYLVPPVAQPLLGGSAGRLWSSVGVREGLLEQQVALGWGMMALSLIAMWAWANAKQPIQPALRVVPVLAIVALTALVCSLSPERAIGGFTFVRPSAWLFRVLPMFRSYARFGVVVQLMAVLLAGIGAEWLWRRPRAAGARIVCVTLLALAAGEYAVWPPALFRDVLPTPAHRWVTRQPGPIHVLDCRPLTAETASIPWLSGNRISMLDGSLDDCDEPDIADTLAAWGYTHLLADGVIHALPAHPAPVYTSRMTSFYGRESGAASSWRWMGPDASWTIVNSSERPLVASADIDIAAFHGDRRLSLLLDGSPVQTLTIEERRGTNRIGPLMLTPGQHVLMFHPAEPPTVADAVLRNGDQRPLSFAIGTWHWTVEDKHR